MVYMFLNSSLESTTMDLVGYQYIDYNHYRLISVEVLVRIKTPRNYFVLVGDSFASLKTNFNCNCTVGPRYSESTDDIKVQCLVVVRFMSAHC